MKTEDKNKTYTTYAIIATVVLIGIVATSVMMLDEKKKAKRPKGYERKMKVNTGGGFSLQTPDFLRFISLP